MFAGGHKAAPGLTRGVVMGTAEFVDDWMEGHRWWLQGRSQVERKTGARQMAPRRAWGDLRVMRQPSSRARQAPSAVPTGQVDAPT